MVVERIEGIEGIGSVDSIDSLDLEEQPLRHFGAMEGELLKGS